MTSKLIAVSEKHYHELRQLGKMGSTFDDVVSILLENNKKLSVEKIDKGLVIGATTK